MAMKLPSPRQLAFEGLQLTADVVSCIANRLWPADTINRVPPTNGWATEVINGKEYLHSSSVQIEIESSNEKLGIE